MYYYTICTWALYVKCIIWSARSSTFSLPVIILLYFKFSSCIFFHFFFRTFKLHHIGLAIFIEKHVNFWIIIVVIWCSCSVVNILSIKRMNYSNCNIFNNLINYKYIIGKLSLYSTNDWSLKVCHFPLYGCLVCAV